MVQKNTAKCLCASGENNLRLEVIPHLGFSKKGFSRKFNQSFLACCSNKVSLFNKIILSVVANLIPSLTAFGKPKG